MRIFLRIVGIVIAVLSLLLLLAAPVAGIVFLVIGALFIFLSIKLPQKTETQKSQITSENIIQKRKHNIGNIEFSLTMKSSKRVIEIPDNTYEDWEKQYKINSDTIFIEYSDFEGKTSSRYIKPQEIYNKGKVIYIRAFCFMYEEERTFRADRITRLHEKPGVEVADIEGFFRNQLNSPSSAADLATEASKE
jgi:Ca2+/Na+ antiporter